MPKSSSTSRTPSLSSASRFSAIAGVTPSSAVSVSSRHSDDGVRPPARSAPATTSSRSGCATWRAERLTEIQAPALGGERAALTARVLEHPRADRDDQPRLLGDRDELGGVDRAAAEAPPAQQRLVAHRHAVAERHDRLEDELELAPLERALEVALRLHAIGRAPAQALVEDLHAPAAALLGAVGRGVGVADQHVGIGRAGRAERDPDARRQRRRAGLGGLLHGRGDAPSERQRGALVDVLADDDELVAAEPRDGVGGPHGGGHPAGERDQQRVAGGVAEEVVDALEVVEVDEQHGRGGARPARRARARARCGRGRARGWRARSAGRGAPGGGCGPRGAGARTRSRARWRPPAGTGPPRRRTRARAWTPPRARHGPRRRCGSAR